VTLVPTLKRLNLVSAQTPQRFPTAIGSAVIAGLAAAASVDGALRGTDGRLWLTATLGIPLFLTISLCLERLEWSRRRMLVAHALGIALLVGFYLVWPGWTGAAAAYRWLQCAIGLHVFLAVLPFVAVGEPDGFWQFNRILLQRFLMSALFTVVLFAGLAMALLTLDNLFGVSVDDALYLQLWAVLALVFTTWVFASGVPKRLETLDTLAVYPTGIRVFAQYILAPLVAVYVILLTAYFAKVVVTASWPSGWIGWLVSSVAVTGILSLLLLDPVRRGNAKSWARAYARWFYVALFPSLIMLLMAIWQRIGQYGITEPRYFLIVLTLWLGLLAVYATAATRSTIKVIPLTLGMLAFGTAWGPWGAYQVSQRSQTERLRDLLERNGVLVEGTVRATTDDVSRDDARQISATLRYLLRNHGAESIAAWFAPESPLSDRIQTLARRPGEAVWDDASTITNALGVSYVAEGQVAGREEYFGFHAAQSTHVRSVSGFDYAVTFGTRSAADTVRVNGRILEIGRDAAGVLLVTLANEEVGRFDLTGLLHQLRATGVTSEVPPDSLRQLVSRGGFTLALDLEHISGRMVDGIAHVEHVTGVLYIDLPEPN